METYYYRLKDCGNCCENVTVVDGIVTFDQNIGRIGTYYWSQSILVGSPFKAYRGQGFRKCKRPKYWHNVLRRWQVLPY